MANTISLAMIVRNEEQTLGRCLESVKDIIDELVLVDTGSDDSTVAIAKKIFGKKAKIIPYEWDNDFSTPRNISFQNCTQTFICWLDADDVVSNPQALKKLIDDSGDSFDVLNLLYDYAKDEFGNSVMVHWRERVVRNIPGAFNWVDRVHEHLTYDPSKIRSARFADTTIVHMRDNTAGNRASKRNLEILEKWIDECGGYKEATSRQLVYLGNERWVNNLIPEAIDAYTAYLQKSDWPEEKIQIHCRLAMYWLEQKDFNKAYQHALAGMLINPSWGEPWLLIAQLQINEGKYANAIVFAENALRCPVPETPLVLNPLNAVYTPKALRYKANILLGNLDEALPDLEECLSIRPSNELKRDYELVTGEQARRRDVEAAVRLADTLDIESLPDNIKSEPVIQDLIVSRIRNTPRVGTPKISIYTGPFLEPWGPESLTTTGLGGSETAAIYMASNLAAKGAQVTVYGEPGPWLGFQGEPQDPLYLPARYFNPEEEVDVFISSRIAEVFDCELNAKERWLWVHDTTLGGSLTADRLSKIDRILAVSAWQAKQYSNLYEGVTAEKLYVTENGLDPSLIMKAMQDGPITKDPYRFMYSSSLDRGLIDLLAIWPELYGMYPQATLHVYYGWDIFDKCMAANPAMRAVKEQILASLDACKDMNVYEHGRVSQFDLYKEALKSSWYVYPSLFNETFCITALEMLACGVTFIASDYGALSETLKGHGVLIPGSPRYPQVRRQFVDAVKTIMEREKTEPDVVKAERIAAVKYALSRDWASVADKWANDLMKDYF